MKKFFTTVLAAMMALSVWAEAPQTISYQAVVRNNVGRLHRDKPVGVRITILSGSEDGQVVYSETRTATTNNNGLLTFAIGDVNAVSSYDLSKIAWAENTYYLRCEMDPDGGNSYTLSSTSQMSSVPYALYAKNIAPEALPSWAQSEEKPVYNYTEIQGAPAVPSKVSQLTNDAGYITAAQVPAVSVPTKVSAFTNDAGYITAAQVPAVNVPTKVSQLTNDKGYITAAEVPAVSVPTKVSQLTNDAGYITEANVTTTLNTINVSELVNDANYVTSADVPTKVSDLTNDKGYITAAEVPAVSVPTKLSAFTNDAGYITAAQVPAVSVPTKVSAFTNDAGYITEANVTTTLNTINVSELVNDANYATTADVPTKVSQLTNDKGYITAAEVPAVSVPTKVSAFTNDAGYITKANVTTTLNTINVSELVNDANYATSADVPTKVSDLTNDAGYITAADVPAVSVPTKLSAFTNDAGYITEANVTTTLNTINVSELVNDANYVTSADVPTKVSDLTNDAGYITAADVPAATVPTKVSAFTNDAGYLTQLNLDDKLKTLNETIEAYEKELETFRSQIANPTVYTLTLKSYPVMGGTPTGAGSYMSGTYVTIEAVPATGYKFVNWSDEQETAKRVVKVEGDISLTANFEKVPQTYVMKVDVSPAASGTVTGAGSYGEGKSASISATAAEGYVFLYWDDGNTSATRSITMNADKNYVAKFAKKNVKCVVNLSASPVAGGSVVGEGNYLTGASCAVQAIPAEGYRFVKWSDGNTNPERHITLSGDLTLTAYFEIPKVVFTEDGAIAEEFSVSADKKVKFSKGNLQYQASTDTWRFAEHQYDIIGANNKNISATYTGWIDLFGWATSGFHNETLTENTSYLPYSTSTASSTYGPSANIVGNYAYYDWGVYNAISNGANIKGLWRTLTRSEWSYLYSGRTNASKLRAFATVDGVLGYVFFPDNWKSSAHTIDRVAIDIKYDGTNTWSLKEWNIIEASGAVFLPAAGRRNGTTVYDVGSDGYYWSSTCYGSSNAYYFRFYSSNVSTSGDVSRYLGHSVRLVQE